MIGLSEASRAIFARDFDPNAVEATDPALQVTLPASRRLLRFTVMARTVVVIVTLADGGKELFEVETHELETKLRELMIGGDWFTFGDGRFVRAVEITIPRPDKETIERLRGFDGTRSDLGPGITFHPRTRLRS
jgi:hypothetical protein